MSENAAWERRRAQQQKDERERQTPVYGSSVGAVYALRAIHERVAARTPRPKDAAQRAARRVRKHKNLLRARRRRFHRPVSAKNAARADA